MGGGGNIITLNHHPVQLAYRVLCTPITDLENKVIELCCAVGFRSRIDGVRQLSPGSHRRTAVRRTDGLQKVWTDRRKRGR